MLKKYDNITLDITALSSDGLGLGRQEGIVVFVPHTLPGDLASVRITKAKKSHAFGVLVSLIKPSPNRIHSDCDHFPACGGCKLRHMDYATEVAAKQSFITGNIQRIGGLSPIFEDITPSPTQNRYRNKVQFPIAMVNGRAEIGFYAGGSHQLIPVSDCKLQPEIFMGIAEFVKNYVNHNNLSVYDKPSHTGLLRHLCIRVNHVGDQIMVVFVINGKSFPQIKDFCGKLVAAFPQIKTVVLSHNTARAGSVMGNRQSTIYGGSAITDEVSGVIMNISANSFFQVNHNTTQLLYNKVAEYAGDSSNQILLDLYCGIGSIGLAVAKTSKQLIGVEIVPDAVEDARINASKNGINARFICGDAGKAATTLAAENLRPDTVIIDPPRKGIDNDTISAIIQMAPSRVVYVSCDSATLARDLKKFYDRGYAVLNVAGFDMFPRTNHVECVCLLEKIV